MGSMPTVIFDYNRTIYDPDNDCLMPHAKQMLDDLKENRVKLFLIAKGDDERKKKIEQLGLVPYFERIIVNKSKSAEDYQSCKDTYPEETDFFAVGDRVKEEIRHANSCGITTIWFRNGKFANEKSENDLEKPKFTVQSLKEVYSIVWDDHYTPAQLQEFDRIAREAKQGKNLSRAFSSMEEMFEDLHKN